ncbi:MAG: hypothetical protein MK076_06925 [Flavobacteriales bacterium]|nr:hypothetical protein [Flavobacteriales bacterium]NQY00396.1 hypothetical protein [Flavobacteriaceae bacterium]
MKAVAKVFNAMSIIFVVILIFWLVKLNYNDLSFKQNRSAYLGISSVLLMIFALQMIKRSVNRKRK